MKKLKISQLAPGFRYLQKLALNKLFLIISETTVGEQIVNILVHFTLVFLRYFVIGSLRKSHLRTAPPFVAAHVFCASQVWSELLTFLKEFAF